MRALRADPTSTRVPIVALADDTRRLALDAAGADATLLIPCAPTVLAERCRQLLDPW